MPDPGDLKWWWAIRDRDSAVVIMAPGAVLPTAVVTEATAERSQETATRIIEGMNKMEGLT
jgi:hypothetical protein